MTRSSRLGARIGASRPLRFLIFGGINTLVGYALYFALVSAGMVFWLANFVCLIFGVCFNFHLQSRYVFHDHDWRRFARFFAGWFCIYLVQIACIALLMTYGLTPLVAGLIVLPGATIISYLVQKLLVFRTGKEKSA